MDVRVVVRTVTPARSRVAAMLHKRQAWVVNGVHVDPAFRTTRERGQGTHCSTSLLPRLSVRFQHASSTK